MKYVRVQWKKIKEYGQIEFQDKKTGICHMVPKLPKRGKATDAGYDVYSFEEGVIGPGESVNFKTGIRMAVRKGWFYSVRGRSGLGFKSVQPFIGTIDATYVGELLILLMNTGVEPYKVNIGDRIAQIIFEEQVEADFEEVEEFSPEFDQRGTAGFGSSGR